MIEDVVDFVEELLDTEIDIDEEEYYHNDLENHLIKEIDIVIRIINHSY